MVVVVAVVGVLVPVLVHMGATERQRLTAQAGHGQQGRDQNRHEDAMRVNDHGTKVTIRHTVVNSSESIPRATQTNGRYWIRTSDPTRVMRVL